MGRRILSYFFSIDNAPLRGAALFYFFFDIDALRRSELFVAKSVNEKVSRSVGADCVG
jgi:hypothetical protein